jgi:hypothetical protein
MITKPLHVATVGKHQLRFFKTPNDDNRPDFPWHAVDDLQQCLPPATGQRAERGEIYAAYTTGCERFAQRFMTICGRVGITSCVSQRTKWPRQFLGQLKRGVMCDGKGLRQS